MTRGYILGNEVYENRNGILRPSRLCDRRDDSRAVKDSPLGKEFDTYKVSTVANSTSTMHTIQNKPITIDCFEIDDLRDNFEIGENYIFSDFIHQDLIPVLEQLRLKYIETGDKRYWKELIRWLPESWLQKRTVTMNYENLLGMCSPGQRRYHKLTEWSKSFIDFARSLPYAQEFIFIDEDKPNDE